jgi:hypothetical protein
VENKFKEEDHKKLIEFLNINTKKAKFEMDTHDIIKYYHLLSHIQKVILPKIEANILEVVDIKEGNKETQE